MQSGGMLGLITLILVNKMKEKRNCRQMMNIKARVNLLSL